MAESNKVFKFNQELWFGFTNLCQEQQTTINTGVKETELRIKYKENTWPCYEYIQQSTEDTNWVTNVMGDYKTSMTKFTKMITFWCYEIKTRELETLKEWN
jgi:hypothetical protein